MERQANWRPDAEQGIAVVRWLLALVSVAVFLGTRAADGNGSLFRSGSVAVGIMLVPVATGGLRWLLASWRIRPSFAAVVLQVTDSAAVIAMMLVAEGFAPKTAWVVLAIPLVVAALRMGAIGVLLTWAALSAGLLLVSAGEGAGGASHVLVFERSGFLLVLAAVVALLTSWLQAGWITQASLTADAEDRVGYLHAVEQAGRSMRGATTAEMVLTALNAALQLGFDAATAQRPDRPLVAIGDGSVIPVEFAFDDVEHGTLDVAEWRDHDRVPLRSVSTVEPNSGNVLTGWSRAEPSRAQIEAFGELVAHAEGHIELGGMLAEARHDAEHDSLTGLRHRRALDRHLAEVSVIADDVAILFIDLDRFKQINDHHGHHAGDRALQEVATRASAVLGDHGFFARYGGDEFVIVLSGPVARFADSLAARLTDAIRAPFDIDGVPIPLSATVGTAKGRGPISLDDLTQRADQAVIEAKAARNSALRRSTGRTTAAPLGNIGSPTGVSPVDHEFGDPEFSRR